MISEPDVGFLVVGLHHDIRIMHSLQVMYILQVQSDAGRLARIRVHRAAGSKSWLLRVMHCGWSMD